jgi:hypothetical protein
MKTMLRPIFYAVTAAAMLSGLAGCTASLPSDSKSNSTLTAGMVKKGLVKGKTTQNEVIQTFGSPNTITNNASGEEVWGYNRMSFDHSSGSSFSGLFVTGKNQALSSSTSKSVDLFVTFNSKDVVQDYKFISSSY